MKEFLYKLGMYTLFVLCVPILLIACIGYLLFVPFDIVRYHKMPYYRDFKNKYQFFITSRDVVKIYNRIVREQLPIEYIKNNLSSDLSLETLSNQASFSAVHFHNFFKKATGTTLHKYVEEQRIKKAINLLLTTNMTLTEIAFECGFSSQTYFSFAFKRKTNLTPRDYVKQAIEKYGTDDI